MRLTVLSLLVALLAPTPPLGSVPWLGRFVSGSPPSGPSLPTVEVRQGTHPVLSVAIGGTRAIALGLS